MKRWILRLVHAFTMVPLIWAVQIQAYEVDNHSAMTAFAIQRSILFEGEVENTELLYRLGLAPSIYYQYFEESLFGTMDQSEDELQRQSVWRLIRNGAMEEDTLLPWYWSQLGWDELKDIWKEKCESLPEELFPRVNHHFFDVRRGLEDPDAGLRPGNFSLGFASPHWALEQAPNDSHPNQFYSYRLFKDYLEDALTEKAGYEEAYAFAFESLGHVVHHIQDMAQPAHVRNDSHCPSNFCGPMQAVLEACENYEIGQDFYNAAGGSVYEAFASFHYGDTSVPPGDFTPRSFSRAEHFWTTIGHRGLADFTSRHFVSPDTNFAGDLDQFSPPDGFAYPTPENALIGDTEEIALLFPDQSGLVGQMAFVKTPLRDEYTDQDLGHVHRTSTYSLFSKDIQRSAQYWSGLPVDTAIAIQRGSFTLNRLNYHSAYRILMPMAIGYSAGFINYAFRGQLEIAKPDRGIYAITDQARGLPFTSLRLKVRNVTPDIDSPEDGVTPQAATGGMLTAVVSYRPNPCYRDDLSGELHEGQALPEGCSLEQFNDTTLHRAVASVDRSAGISSDDWEEIEFNFSADPIPLSARDIQVRLVYRGTLGHEEDGIAIGHRDISEPTWIVIHNSTDIINVNGTNQFGDVVLNDEEFLEDWELDTPEEIEALSKQQIYDLRTGFNSGGVNLAGPTRANVYGYTRIAVLADPMASGPINFSGRFDNTGNLVGSALPSAGGLQVPAHWDVAQVADRYEFKPAFCIEGDGCLGSRLLDARGVSGFYINYWLPALGNSPADLEGLSTIPMPYVEAPSPTPVSGE